MAGGITGFASAMCATYHKKGPVKNKLVATGTTYHLPFSITLTEVPAPSPVSP